MEEAPEIDSIFNNLQSLNGSLRDETAQPTPYFRFLVDKLIAPSISLEFTKQRVGIFPCRAEFVTSLLFSSRWLTWFDDIFVI